MGRQSCVHVPKALKFPKSDIEKPNCAPVPSNVQDTSFEPSVGCELLHLFRLVLSDMRYKMPFVRSEVEQAGAVSKRSTAPAAPRSLLAIFVYDGSVSSALRVHEIDDVF